MKNNLLFNNLYVYLFGKDIKIMEQGAKKLARDYETNSFAITYKGKRDKKEYALIRKENIKDLYLLKIQQDIKRLSDSIQAKEKEAIEKEEKKKEEKK
jgi:UDP-N-acetyl-D-mannosaminuronic acid transferase (WecB/TagA/CpsF family)